MNQLLGRWARFSKLTVHERCLFLEALFYHLMAGTMLMVLPFRWVPRLFSGPQRPGGNRQLATNLQGLKYIELIRDALIRAGKISPWRNRCLVSSLAGKCMLKRRRISSQLFLGMTKDEIGKFVAHAWLVSDGIELVRQNGTYTVLYTF